MLAVIQECVVETQKANFCELDVCAHLLIGQREEARHETGVDILQQIIDVLEGGDLAYSDVEGVV